MSRGLRDTFLLLSVFLKIDARNPKLLERNDGKLFASNFIYVLYALTGFTFTVSILIRGLDPLNYAFNLLTLLSANVFIVVFLEMRRIFIMPEDSFILSVMPVSKGSIVMAKILNIAVFSFFIMISLGAAPVLAGTVVPRFSGILPASAMVLALLFNALSAAFLAAFLFVILISIGGKGGFEKISVHASVVLLIAFYTCFILFTRESGIKDIRTVPVFSWLPAYHFARLYDLSISGNIKGFLLLVFLIVLFCAAGAAVFYTILAGTYHRHLQTSGEIEAIYDTGGSVYRKNPYGILLGAYSKRDHQLKLRNYSLIGIMAVFFIMLFLVPEEKDAAPSPFLISATAFAFNLYFMITVLITNHLYSKDYEASYIFKVTPYDDEEGRTDFLRFLAKHYFLPVFAVLAAALTYALGPVNAFKAFSVYFNFTVLSICIFFYINRSSPLSLKEDSRSNQMKYLIMFILAVPLTILSSVLFNAAAHGLILLFNGINAIIFIINAVLLILLLRKRQWRFQ